MKVNLVGKTFGRLSVISRADSHVSQCGKKSTAWNCICECGNKAVVTSTRLLRGYTKSCGCYRRDVTTANNIKHGSSDTKLYYIWKNMKDRCYREKNRFYSNYGGRGIKVCSEWLDFNVFKEWAMKHGYREGLSIDRIDNNKGYFPNNCRWIPKSSQQRNRRSCVYLTYDNKSYTVSEWARLFGLNHRSVLEYVRTHGAEKAVNYYLNHYGNRLKKVEVM